MFSSGTVFLAALATHRPVLASSISSRSVVRRFLGEQGNHVLNASATDSIIRKTNGQGLPGEACIVGRAGFYAQCGNPEAAVTEIEKIFSEIRDPDLKRHALGIRLRARNDLLDIKEAALKVESISTEMEICTLRTAIREDYEAFKKASPGCWLVEMVAAEYALYEGRTEDAYHALFDVEEKIVNFISSLENANVSSEVATVENTKLFSLLTFLLRRAHDAEGVKPSTSKFVEENIKNMLKDDLMKAPLASFKKELGVSLTDEEAVEVAYILDMAHVHHHFHECFPLDGEYNDWNSEAAKKTMDEILQVYAPKSVPLSNELLENVKKSVPFEPFYAPKDQLQKFLSSSSGQKNLLAGLRATFGPGPECVLARSDEAHFEAMRVLKEAPVSADAAGSVSYPLKQNEISCRLARQFLYRTRINEAVALTQMDRATDAVKILDEVIAANEFIYMWRAFLARGEANKRLGLINKSDKDFRQLSNQKKVVKQEA